MHSWATLFMCLSLRDLRETKSVCEAGMERTCVWIFVLEMSVRCGVCVCVFVCETEQDSV